MLFLGTAAKSLARGLSSSSSKCLLLILLAATCLTEIRLAQAEFSLNFLPENRRYGEEWINFNCNRPYAPGGNFESCDENDEARDNNGRDSTAFLHELVRESGTGQQYYHVIVGLPGDDFVQEAYIKIRSGGRGDDQGPISDSLGNTRPLQNNRDPLGPAEFSGSGTANPNSVQFKQVVNSDDMFQDIEKATYTQKPWIVQDIVNPDIDYRFALDMSNSNYSQDNLAPASFINRVEVGFDDDLDLVFDIDNVENADGPGSTSVIDVTAGKFKWERKNAANGSSYVDEYTYSDAGSGYNVNEEDWWAWRDPAQNPCESLPRNFDDEDTPKPAGYRCHLYGGSPYN